MRFLSRWDFSVATAAFGVTLTALAAPRAPFLSPEESMKTFQLEPGLRVELVAAEPLVIDPVALAFDDQRRLYVVENRGYPSEVKSNQSLPDADTTKLGRIALLEDTDGDGRYDKRTEFATGLTYPNGIAVWKGGVFVSCAPDILYLKDTDGDGVADVRQVVLTGFETTRTTQLRVSFPTLGFDGKFYVASGLNGGSVTSPEHPERAPVAFQPADGRFDPESFLYERTGGRGQFGLAFDAFGRRFVCSNRHPVEQIVLEPWQLARNPHLAASEMTQEVSKVEAQAKVFTISRSVITADYMPGLMSKPHTGTFTSACGVHVFEGAGLTPEHVGNVFICEPAQNLVQRQVIRPEGASFRSDLPYQGREFLASTDVWFRPVFVCDGPDGAMYVADMNRREIDHPQYVPEESRAQLDFVGGKNTSGRIYRIVRANAPKKPTPAIAATGTSLDDLITGLEADDGWWRERARRRLLETADGKAASRVEKVALSASQPESRAAALWVLRDLKQLSPDTLRRALRDDTAGVREQAVLLAGEAFAAAPELLDLVIGKSGDADARVRFNTALVLGDVRDAKAVPALAAIAMRDGADRWTRAAVLSGVGARMGEFLAALTALPNRNGEAFAAVMEDLGRVFGAGAPLDACRAFLAEALKDSGDLGWRLPAVVGLADGLRGRAEFKNKNGASILNQLASSAAVDGFVRTAAATAANGRAPLRQRTAAIALLGTTDFTRAGEILGSLLDARQPPDVQLQAVRALDRIGDPRGAELLVRQQNWSRYTATLREAVIASLTAKPKMIEVLFAAIRSGVVKPSDLSSQRRTQLQKNSDPKIKEAAVALFQNLESGDRMKVYQAHRDLLKNPGDPDQGATVFARVCSACHTHQGVGGKVGPDLTGVRNQPADALMLHILVPNYEVAPQYQTMTVTTDDGRTISGWLASETDTSISLRTAAGTEESLLRKNIASLTASGLSLMPDGLEQAMTKAELVNLIAFLKREPPAGR